MSTISHDGESRPVVEGKTLFDYADELSLEVPTSCHRNGRCHECVVEVTGGLEALSPPSEAESFLRGNYRLACQAAITRDDVDVTFAPLRRRPRILMLSRPRTEVALDPVVTRGGEEVLYDGEAIDRYRGRILGLAIDLGTTTVVLDFIDLESGESLHTSAFENPQRFGGSDIMHRISYDGGAAHAGELHNAIAAAINRAIIETCDHLGLRRRVIYEIVIAANTTMRELLFKLDVQSIGQKPYKSSIEDEHRAGVRPHTALLERARRLGLRASPQARVYGLPLIASHVGADAAAGLIAVGLLGEAEETAMLVDMGTNTEVVLKRRGRLLAASCPAGPAFEGGLIKYGVPAYDGAIESVRLADVGVRYETIGGGPATGICGSGLIDLLAELRRHDRMTAKGVFTADRRQFEMIVVPEHGITFSKEDASNLAQAKAANYCGQYIVMRSLGIDPADIDRLYLAGGFATYVDIRNAIDIGLLPPVPVERIVKVGNAAVQGAREILLSKTKRRALETAVQTIDHVELETTPDFFEIFVDACQFKPMPDVLPPPAEPARHRSAG